jgi:predicted DNA-binding transcriptional regulator AlpA
MSKHLVANTATDGEPDVDDTESLLADFLTQDEAAAALKICEKTLDRWRRLGEGPPITKLGRRVLYRRSSLQAWLRTRERRGDAA